MKTRVTAKDRARLGPHLANYNLLNEILLLNNLSVEDVHILLELELQGKARRFVLYRLIGRIKSKERKQLIQCVNQKLKQKSERGVLTTGSYFTSSSAPVVPGCPIAWQSVRPDESHS